MFESLRPVGLSERAAEEVRKIMVSKGIPEGYALRVGVRGGGCAGVNLMIGFDKQKEHDLHYEILGIPILVDKRQTMYLIGKRVDFYEGADARGFHFVEEESLPSTQSV